MRVLIMAPVILAQLLLAAGCASVNWSRSNTDEAALNADLRDCERQARADAPQLSASAGSSSRPLVTPYGITRADAPSSEVLNTFPPVDASRENSLIASCMQGKGYREVAGR